MSNGTHYSEDDLKNFLSPDFTAEHKDAEMKIIEHLKNCEECSVRAKNIQERDWQEIRKGTVGFG